MASQESSVILASRRRGLVRRSSSHVGFAGLSWRDRRMARGAERPFTTARSEHFALYPAISSPQFWAGGPVPCPKSRQICETIRARGPGVHDVTERGRRTREEAAMVIHDPAVDRSRPTVSAPDPMAHAR
jgi:hypothetical protein